MQQKYAIILRKAVVADASEIKKLIEPFVKKGLMLPRSLMSLYSAIRDFWVMVEDDNIVGCCAMHISWEDIGEIRTLAVKIEKQGQGRGHALLKKCTEDAKELGLQRLFTLTYIPDFFIKTGYKKVEKSTLPNKIWADCINCPQFPDCNEEALVFKING